MRPFSAPGADHSLSTWNALPYVEGDVYGSIDANTLVAADFVPDASTYVPETTNRTTTSKGVYQDYYGGDPRDQAWAGAVSRPPR